MTRRSLALAMVVLLPACSWSNSLYQANVLSRVAIRDEREGRPGDAQPIWGQVSVKADSAFARAPRGRRGVAALWVGGHADVRLRNCSAALPKFQQALFLGPDPRWRDEMILELAGCQALLDPVAAAATYATLTKTVTDTGVRRLAGAAYGHVLLGLGDWNGVLSASAGIDTLPARLDRAMADAWLGRGHDALVELRPSLQPVDTSVAWTPLVSVLAANAPAATDTVLTALLGDPRIGATRGSDLLFAAATAASDSDSTISDRWLAQLVVRPATRTVADGRFLQRELWIRRSTTVAQLRVRLDSLGALPDGGSVAGARLAELVRNAARLVRCDSSLHATEPAGPLTLIALAAFARDTLQMPRIGNALLVRLENEWPQSPYVGKALLIRVAFDHDSTDVVRARALTLTDNPYIAQGHGDRGAQIGFFRLEDSLAAFMRTRWLPAVARPVTVLQE